VISYDGGLPKHVASSINKYLPSLVVSCVGISCSNSTEISFMYLCLETHSVKMLLALTAWCRWSNPFSNHYNYAFVQSGHWSNALFGVKCDVPYLADEFRHWPCVRVVSQWRRKSGVTSGSTVHCKRWAVRGDEVCWVFGAAVRQNWLTGWEHWLSGRMKN
jgi:hypothetical protein